MNRIQQANPTAKSKHEAVELFVELFPIMTSKIAPPALRFKPRHPGKYDQTAYHYYGEMSQMWTDILLLADHVLNRLMHKGEQ